MMSPRSWRCRRTTFPELAIQPPPASTTASCPPASRSASSPRTTPSCSRSPCSAASSSPACTAPRRSLPHRPSPGAARGARVHRTALGPVTPAGSGGTASHRGAGGRPVDVRHPDHALVRGGAQLVAHPRPGRGPPGVLTRAHHAPTAVPLRDYLTATHPTKFIHRQKHSTDPKPLRTRSSSFQAAVTGTSTPSSASALRSTSSRV